MKKSILMSGLAAIFLFGACQQMQTGEGGMKYKIVTDAGNVKAQDGDLLSLNVIIKTDRDSILSNTHDIGIPQIVTVVSDSTPGIYPGDHNTMFKMLGEGDSAVFHLDMDTMNARTGQPTPDFFDRYVVFEIKVNRHFQKGELTDSALYAEVNTYMDEQVGRLKDLEEGKVSDYIAKNNLETETTESGLQIVFTEKGTDATPNPTDTVVVNYTGSLTNGKVFDTSIQEIAEKEGIFNPMRPYEPARFTIGVGQVIPGWDEGLLLAPKGSKFKLIIPSALAYGQMGDQRGSIPPYAPLVFDIELIDVVPATTDGTQDTTGNQ